jgi:nicotinamide mononucleotide transporter
MMLGSGLDKFTDSTVPFWDGMTTAAFITAMLLMAKKRIENWIWWIAGDVACIPLFLYKGLCLSSFQYAVFTCIAIAGYIAWYAKLRVKSQAGR